MRFPRKPECLAADTRHLEPPWSYLDAPRGNLGATLNRCRDNQFKARSTLTSSLHAFEAPWQEGVDLSFRIITKDSNLNNDAYDDTAAHDAPRDGEDHVDSHFIGGHNTQKRLSRPYNPIEIYLFGISPLGYIQYGRPDHPACSNPEDVAPTTKGVTFECRPVCYRPPPHQQVAFSVCLGETRY
ncbi:hypothetical protein FKP32DRAFT_1712549 [Trametes sanguinea]|nr:hypothetical protein FKP32DRAFT_1712549 [Trametes sanguinea]